MSLRGWQGGIRGSWEGAGLRNGVILGWSCFEGLATRESSTALLSFGSAGG